MYVASVNGEGIRQSSYDVSMAQFMEAQAKYGSLLDPGEEAKDRVLESLINRVHLAQGARAAGFVVEESLVEARIAQLTEDSGGPEALAAWMEKYGYDLDSFRVDLALEIEAAWQKEQIANSVPESAEQVKARQIFFYDAYMANRAYSQLEGGASFDSVAAANDPQNLGYLDWFPRGYLLYPELEIAAFSLSPGQYSAVIETAIGYHILYILDYDPAWPLSADARLTLQEMALAQWLIQKRAESHIEIYLP